MCHVCAILVGTAGTLVMAAPPMIAAVWFPPKERATATGMVGLLVSLPVCVYLCVVIYRVGVKLVLCCISFVLSQTCCVFVSILAFFYIFKPLHTSP